MGRLSLLDGGGALLEGLARAIPGGPCGWAPERLIFRDWWHWRDHELGFAHGRLALTGQNGSGKSTLLSLCLPTLLDGDTAGGRLDPALSRDRHVSWYLLGNEDADPEQPDAFAYAARTGYVALEFRHGATGRHLTIGMGVSAARNHPRLVREWWGFVVPDRRLGRDWDVRDADGANCLGLRELQKCLPPPCVVTAERAEYRRQVNAHLFDMEDDDYQALITMLLQARRPKLGEQAGPDQVCRLLRDALPGVPAERLERVAEVVENIERYQRNLQGAAARAEVVAEVDARLRKLADVLVQDAARAYHETADQFGNVAGRLRSARADLAAAEGEIGGLRAAAAARAQRRSEVEAALAAYGDRPDTDLPRQVASAQADADKAEAYAAHLEGLLRQAELDLLDHAAALVHAEQRFRRKRDDVAHRWRGLAESSQAAAWRAGEGDLRQAADAAAGLEATSAEVLIRAAWPAAGLADEGRALALAYRDLAERRVARDATEAEVRGRREHLSALRAAQSRAADGEARAQARVSERRDELAAALETWRAESPALSLDEAGLAPVLEAVVALEAVPAAGAASLFRPLRHAAETRRTVLDAAREEALQEAGRAAVLVESLDTKVAGLREQGVLPERSALRRAARAAAEGPAGPQPLFRWIRFRDGIDELTAAAVEAAGLEAGLFDLLVDDGEGDAWVLPPGAAEAGDGDVPTLLEVLEPESGAPPAVTALLGAVGWGDGRSEVWIAADGRWRHGRAAGRVAPWLGETAGVVGEARRALALAARLEVLDRTRQGAAARRAAALSRAAEAGRAARDLSAEIDAATALPWQPLFSALQERAAASQAAEEAQSLVEAARPAYEEAVAAHQQAHAAYEVALGPVPAARSLDGEGLRTRAAELAHLAQRIAEPDPEDLMDLVRAYRGRADRRAQDAARADALRPQLEQARRGLAGERAHVAALQDRLRDPDVARLRRAIIDLTEEQARIAAADQEDGARADALAAQCERHRTVITEREPEERHLRVLAGERLLRLKERLRLHEAFAGHAEAIDREGPVAVLPRLPQAVEGGADAIDAAIQTAKSELQSYVYANMDLLGDERPQAVGAWDSLVFHREREELCAAELGRRLAEEAERDRRLIADEERQLYERIIYQGILDVLRQLIGQARAFTKRTNEKLRGLRLSGGERLHLRLVPCEAAEIPGAAVGRALEELDQGTDWLSEERREILLRQIRAEVERVRHEATAGGEALGYYEAIRRALDYRRWYEYHLWSEAQGSGQSVEVRSRGFGRRSTSAKAWALAVPVLAGVAARYEAAKNKDAPRMVALDEAFAGFDANNQANYLQFLGGMGLCWVITCPDELPYGAGLAAAMAYRLSLEDNVHTAFPILWDGTGATELLLGAEREVAAAADDRDGRPVEPGDRKP